MVAAGCLFVKGVEVVGLSRDEFEGLRGLGGEFIPLVGVGPTVGIGDMDRAVWVWSVWVEEEVDGIVPCDEELIGSGYGRDEAGGDGVTVVGAAIWVFEARDHEGLVGRVGVFGRVG